MDDLADMFSAIEKAAREALALHERGECHLSEWSCSYCEFETCPCVTPPGEPDYVTCQCPRWPTPHLVEHGCPTPPGALRLGSCCINVGTDECVCENPTNYGLDACPTTPGDPA